MTSTVEGDCWILQQRQAAKASAAANSAAGRSAGPHTHTHAQLAEADSGQGQHLKLSVPTTGAEVKFSTGLVPTVVPSPTV